MSQTITVPNIGDLEFPDGMSEAEMASAIQKNYPQIHAPQAQAQPPQTHYGEVAQNLLGGATEPMMTMATGMAGQVAGGLAGLGTIAGNAMGLTDAKPADVVNNVQGAMTYQPRTQGGKDAMSVIGAPGEAIANAANYVGEHTSDFTGSPALGAGVNAIIQTAPLLVGAKGYAKSVAQNVAKRAEEVARQMSRNATNDATLKRLSTQGYKFTPGVVDDSSIGMRVLQSISGKAKTNQAFNIYDQKVTDGLAKKYIDVADNSALGDETINELQQQYNIPYEQVADLPGGVVKTETIQSQGTGALSKKETIATGRELLDQLNEARLQAKLSRTENKRTGRASAYNRAVAMENKASSLEDSLDKFAIDSGQPNLVQAMRDARIQKAKIYTIDDALNDDTGHVNALDLARAKNAGVPMSAEAKNIASFGNGFKDLAKVPDSGASLPGSPLDLYGGYLTAGLLPLSRMAARKYLLSEAGQSALLKNRYKGYTPSLSDTSSLVKSSGMMQHKDKK